MPIPKIFLRCIETARIVAPSYKHYDHFHTTFMIHKNRILTMGINNPRKTHPYNRLHPYSNEYVGLHSELAAIIHSGLSDCSQIVFLNVKIGKTGNIFFSKPCLGCQSVLKQVGFKKMFYTTNDEDQMVEEWL